MSTTNALNEYAGFFSITNASSSQRSLVGATIGTGGAGYFEIFNSTNTSDALYVKTNGLGSAGIFEIDNLLSVNEAAIQAKTNSDFGPAGSFRIFNSLSCGSAVQASTNGKGDAVAGFGGSGRGGYFTTSSDEPALEAFTLGTGSAFTARHKGSSGSIAVFKDDQTPVARIDKAGVGYFNGGTQNSGADLAEAFDVWGELKTYEPGDVLVISQEQDRTVEKSMSSYSNLIAGVYATKPGVLLTEENIDTDLSDKVPMGIVGVIPTKICNEGGPINRGDMLVTASLPGYAMKADLQKVEVGQVLGKALENFSGQTGKIKVLVSIW
ncbi:MAG: hypothetical protein HKN76_18645 [Saprospiraceae bacterium]|nr:hypothetical protein [Saprospiraceae bacterium]